MWSTHAYNMWDSNIIILLCSVASPTIYSRPCIEDSDSQLQVAVFY